ncbi:hypothetical protein AQUCO_00600318v1 [Aquilegia coerulea]|uniref:AAA+ ATPase domain-containing protein n=1 Tax=Aquilegia coerulea TaxID=218851 RepID=A0A2G5EPK3_AQUCA|nr:hypothetical protein AQUCO_00600318v1 [Aquilegia coerulea]
MSNYGVMGVQVSCFNQSMMFYNGDKDRFHVGKLQSLEKYRSFGSAVSISCSSLLCFSSWRSSRCEVRNESLGKKKIRSQIDTSRENRKTHSGKSGSSESKKRFSLRLRPRLRLLSMRLKRVSIRAVGEEFKILLGKNLKKVTLSTFISLLVGLCYLFLKLTSVPLPRAVPYSELILNLQTGSVSNVLFEEGSRRIFYNTVSKSSDNSQLLENQSPSGDISEKVDDTTVGGDETENPVVPGVNILEKISGKKDSTPEWQYSTRKIDHDENFLLTLMREKGTAYSSAPQSALISPAKKRRPTNQIVSFNDVEGVDTAKAELLEIVLCLQGSINYSKLGAKLPRGVLLVGPPGTGKTLLARAVAGEAGVPFFTVSASEFVEMFVGRGAARIRDLFSVARKYAPSIIFIDELDAVGGKRGRSFNDERDQTLNQLLTEMDGFETDMKVVVIAATNRPEALDSALCRPGRFSRKVYVGEPDEDGRRKILAVHLRGVPLEEDPHLICNLVASLTKGFVGADLANLVNEAALLAARRGGETVDREDIMDAIERAKFGINNKQVTPSTIKRELGKLFPWMPSLTKKNDAKEDGLEGPIGYQTLS